MVMVRLPSLPRLLQPYSHTQWRRPEGWHLALHLQGMTARQGSTSTQEEVGGPNSAPGRHATPGSFLPVASLEPYPPTSPDFLRTGGPRMRLKLRMQPHHWEQLQAGSLMVGGGYPELWSTT